MFRRVHSSLDFICAARKGFLKLNSKIKKLRLTRWKRYQWASDVDATQRQNKRSRSITRIFQVVVQRSIDLCTNLQPLKTLILQSRLFHVSLDKSPRFWSSTRSFVAEETRFSIESNRDDNVTHNFSMAQRCSRLGDWRLSTDSDTSNVGTSSSYEVERARLFQAAGSIV